MQSVCFRSYRVELTEQMPRHLKIPKKFIACTVFTFAYKNEQAAIQHSCICSSVSHMAASGGCSQIIYCHRAKNIVTLVHSVSITCFPHSGEVVWRIFFLDWRANCFLYFFGVKVDCTVASHSWMCASCLTFFVKDTGCIRICPILAVF